MQYVISSRWSLTERFVITDASQAPVYEVRGRFSLSQLISIYDMNGQELAALHKHMLSNRFDISVQGNVVAEVAHTGFFGNHYQVGTPSGPIDAQGDFAGWDYTLTRDANTVASVGRRLAFRETFDVDISQGEDDVLLLAIILAIDTIHEDRRGERQQGIGLGGII